ncbi:MAG: phage major capsid protein [Intestinimonas sp.]|uniref:phage major capsid protein n=1 Tax=Intestinimonas sp. TaxID=1965293 RepID=UPI002A913C1B|nr:phage major capsid protein [Intestinimonas sp.]MDY5337946.1 phage major capsid protein [Intestinimonas sp.]
MDFIQKINDLRAQKADLLAKAETFAQEGNTEEINKISDQMKGINASIASYEALAEESRRNADPIDPSAPKDETGVTPKDERKAPCPFTSLGEQLQAIYKQQSQGIQDKRLAIVQDAAKGANEGVGSEGGFAVQEDFAGQILASAVQNSPLLQRLDSYTVGAASNSARWLQVDETDVSKSVFGGIQMYWVSEAHTVASSKPKFREVRMDLEKMMGLAYATDELLQDAPFMTGFFGNAFSLAADRLMTEGVISGDGAGKMTGILKSDALITVAKTTGQTAGTFTGDNAIKMLARSMPRNRDRLVWVMHPDLEEQLPYLSITSGGETKFLWNPEGGLGNFDTQRVLNKPVLFEDSCSALGSAGDILLIDPKEYMLLRKGTAKQDWSIHVEFLTDQQCFRFVFRCNGAPKIKSPMTIKNSSKTRSPFVTLAART